MQNIDFFSFKDAPDALKSQWNQIFETVLESGYLIGGPIVQDFESNWASYLGVKHALGVGNGYDALFISLKILGIGPGDFVAVPSHTFMATWLAVSATGATPVGIDCDNQGLIDLHLLEKSDINFKVVIPVHMHGQMVDMERLMNWAKKEKVKVIEDCAQAHGAKIQGMYAGTWGDIGAFSFYPTKNLGAAGDAGAIVTNDTSLYVRARGFANYGSEVGQKYSYESLGINSRLDPIQAGLLNINLSYLENWNEARREIACLYEELLQKNNIPYLDQTPESVFHHFIIFSKKRDLTRELLLRSGIKTEIHYPEPAQISHEKITKTLNRDIPRNAIQLSRNSLSLPMYPWLPKESVIEIVNTLKEPAILSSII
jgi:dTDP-4-amino-4,6-dideoxygalactose transaminase